MRTSSITGEFEASDKFEAFLDHAHHRRQIGARIQKPDLRLHREGVGALLHDRGAFAVILADHDQAPPVTPLEDRFDSASDATLVPAVDFQVTAPRTGYMTDAESVAAAAGFGSGRLEMDAEVVHHVLGVGEDVHEMRDRRALIAGDVRNAGLQQGLGDRENAFAAKDFAGA